MHELTPFDADVLPLEGIVPKLRAIMPVPFDTMFDPMDGNWVSLFARVSEKVATVLKKNSVLYYKEHPNEETGLSMAGSVSLCPDSGGQADAASVALNLLSSYLRLK